MLGLVQHQVAPGHHTARGRAGAFGLAGFIAAEQGTDALQQQALAEWLGDVVVGAEAQAHQFIDLLVLGRQEDHRHGRALAQALQQLHPIHARHLDVEHRQIHRFCRHALKGAFAIRIGADDEAFLL